MSGGIVRPGAPAPGDDWGARIRDAGPLDRLDVNVARARARVELRLTRADELVPTEIALPWHAVKAIAAQVLMLESGMVPERPHPPQ